MTQCNGERTAMNGKTQYSIRVGDVLTDEEMHLDAKRS